MTNATLEVSGMHCGSCVALIEETLAGSPGVGSIKVDLEAAKADVSFDPAATSIEVLCSEITDLGYPTTPARAG